MTIRILAGGTKINYPSNFEQVLEKTKNDFWIGVDYGALYLINHGAKIDVAVGDFDSISSSELEKIQKNVSRIIKVSPVKDYTDTEISLIEILKKDVTENIILYGATGGRIDHLMANLFFILKPEFKDLVGRIKIVDLKNEISFLKPGKNLIKHDADKKYISYITLGDVRRFSISKHKYNLEARDEVLPNAYVSNELNEHESQGIVSFESGIVCLIRSKD